MEVPNNYKPADWETNFESKLTVKSSLPYKEYTGPIEKSGNDKNQYRLIRLPKNLTALCVQDLDTKEAAASLSVNIGLSSSPVELQDRELNAVDSEHKGNLQSDPHRFYGLMSSISNLKHPYSWFTTGNTETLKGAAEKLGLDLREELIKFYHKYYSADIMRLVVVGNHSLDVLSEWVTSKFSDVKSKGNTKPMFNFHPIGYSSGTSYDGFGTYEIGVTATPEGLENYKAIVSVIFGYIKMLIENGPQEWYYQELAEINQAEFDFKDKKYADTYARTLSGEGHNQYVPPQNILSHHYLSSGYDADIISKCLDYLNPSNYRLFIGAQEHKAVECKLEEKYYGVLYNVADLPSHMTSDLKCSPSVAKMLHLPGRNAYLPESLSLTKPATIADPPALEPVLLRKNDKFEAWFKQDDQFFTPHGHIGLAISSEYVDNSPLNHLLSTLLCKIVSAELREQLFGALRANSNFYVTPSKGSINVEASGVSSGLPLLLRTVLQKIKTFKVDTQQFSIYQDEIERMIQSERLDDPLSLIFRQLDDVNMVPAFDQDMLEEALKDITLDGLQKHIELLFSKAYVKMLVSGNYNQSVALDTSNQVLDLLQLQPVSRPSINARRILDIEPGYYVQNVPISDRKCLNSAGESNPIYVTQRINEFIRQYRQKLQELTVDEFESSIQSLIGLKQEKLKSINEESGELWAHIKSGKYSFDKVDKDVEHLKQLSKDDLLAFWDKYVNEDTAQGYTRLDMQMSSAKIWQPTAEEFEMYPSTILALYGSLHSEGHTSLSIPDVQSFVSSADASSSIESLLAELSELYVTKQVPPVSSKVSEVADTTVVNVEAPGIVFESLSKIASALQMAISSVNETPKFATLGKTNFANIDMKQSPEGIWLINDYKRFQQTQELHGISVPLRKLVPLIADSVQADNNWHLK
ncbi:metalloprotease [Coemansia sp. RSA 2337]|nr:metalloprotease [Coemansia sp. RSA 2337]